MVEKPQGGSDSKAGATATAAPPPRRGPGHRSHDVRDTVAEMAARAHEISLEAGSKMAAAMKDVINAAAGITGFAIESARDLVQYMVRRGQMTQDEADKLLREAESASRGRKPPAKPARAGTPARASVAVKSTPPKAAKPAARAKPPARPAKKAPARPAKKAPAKSASRKSVKPSAKKKR